MATRSSPALCAALLLLIAGCASPGTSTVPQSTGPSASTAARSPESLAATPSGERAYPDGVAWAVPGTIAIDNYDFGGRDVAYHTLARNNPGGAYRHDGVGIEKTTDTGGNGYDVGWNANGNWYRYTVAVAQTGSYEIAVRIASVLPAGEAATFHIEDETGTNLTGAVIVPVTGGFQRWSTLMTKASLTAGSHVLKVAVDTGHASFNFTTMTFSTTAVASPTPTPTPSATPSHLPSPSPTPSVSPTPVHTPSPTPITSSSPTPPPVTGGLPTTIVNNSGIAGWFYIFGSDANGIPMHVRPDGAVVANSLADRDASGHVDYSVPIAATGSTTFRFPHLNGRMYVSLGQKLSVSGNVDARGRVNVSTPVGWNPRDANYAVLHDWVEYAYSGTTFNVNVTAVDMYGLPMSITLDGRTTQKTGSLPGARSAIFAGLRADPNFAGTVLTQNAIDLRALSPGHAAGLGLFSPTYLDPYISQVWSYYTNHTYTIANQPGVSGSVDSTNTLRFTKSGAPYIAFAKPTTLDVFGCSGAIISPNTAAGGLGSDLCAALNRGTALAAVQPDNVAADFYGVPLTNVYSRVIHQYSIAGKAYGFPYDDNGGFSSFVADGQPRAFTVTIERL